MRHICYTKENVRPMTPSKLKNDNDTIIHKSAKKGDYLDNPYTEDTTIEKITYRKIWHMKNLRYQIMSFALSVGIEVSYNEIFPLFLLASVSVGGISLTSKQIGIILFITGIFGIISSFVYNSILTHLFKKNTIKMLRYCFIITGITSTLIPVSSMLHFSSGQSMIWATIINTIRAFFMAWIIISSVTVINRAAPPSQLGFVNGVSQTCVQFTRIVSPMIFTFFFALTLKYQAILFNYYMPFFIMGLIWFIIYVISLQIDDECKV